MAALLIVSLLLTAVSSSASIVYIISASGGQPCPPHHTCHNLSYYLSYPVNYVTGNIELLFLEGHHQLESDAAVKLQGVGSLRLIGGGQWMKGPEETVMQSTAVIHCSKTRGGLAFHDFSYVAIRGLTFIGCGAYFPSQNRFVDFGVFQAGVLLSNISVLNLLNVSVQESNGYGLAAIDCKQIDVISSSFAYSNLKSYPRSNQYQEGGNMCIIYASTIRSPTLFLSNSNFTKGQGIWGGGVVINTREHFYSPLKVAMQGLVLCSNTATLGAGLAILMGQGVLSITITNTLVKNGYGYDLFNKYSVQYPSEGGGIYIDIGPNVTNSVINMDQMTFTGNIASKGGAISLRCNGVTSFQLHNTILSQLNHTSTTKGEAIVMNLKNCLLRNTFLNNLTLSTENAYKYGISLFGSSKEKARINVANSIFVNNRNMLAILLVSSIECSILNSKFLNNSGGTSVISLVGDVTAYFKNNLISNNKMTAITAGKAIMVFLGENVIQNNSNTNGAGIYMTWTSRILVNVDSKLFFLNNTATKIGGAILIQSSPLAPILEYLCSIAPDYHLISSKSTKPQLIFSGNHATEGGSDIYGGRLLGCDITSKRLYSKHIPRQGTSNETSYYFDITALSKHVDFQFINPDKLSSMSSDPIMVCFCNDSFQPNCSNRSRPHFDIYPGLEVLLSIATVGYYGGFSLSTVRINAQNADLVSPDDHLKVITTECTHLRLLLQATDTPTLAQVTIAVTGGVPGWEITLDVDINDCPQGFHKGELSATCQCAPFLLKHDITCNITLPHSRFERIGNKWFAYLDDSQLTSFNTSQCLTAFTNCPFDYCNSSSTSFDIQYPDSQCTNNRTGILCGQCQPGLSLLLGSNRCDSCSNMFLLLLLFFVLAGIVLVAVLMALNMTVSVGAVNGLLFYAHITKLNEAFFFRNGQIPVLSQFIAWLNLDLGIEVCFFDGLDGYWKTWLQFAFPGYLFLLMGAIIIGCRYSVRLCRLCGSYAVPALATLFLMSYTKILQTVSNALAMSQLVCDNSDILKVWSVDGNVAYFSGKHLSLLIFSCCVMLVGVIYPLLVLCAPLLERYSYKCFPTCWNPVAKLKPLLDAYGGPYKDQYRSWTGVTLVARLLVTVVFSFTSGDMVSLNCYIISFVVLVIFSAWLFMKGVYKSTFMNTLDVIFLVNLFVLSNASSAAFNLGSSYYQQVATIVSVSISMILFLFIIVFHILNNKRFKFLKKTLGLHTQQLSVFAADSSSNVTSRPGSPHSSEHVSERRGRFDLVFERPDTNSENTSSVPVLREREPLLF